MSSRLITGFTFPTGATDMVFTHSVGGDATVSFDPAETYLWSLDDATSGFIDAGKFIEDELGTAWGVTVTVDIVGVSSSTPGVAEGRLEFTVSSGTIDVKLSDAAFTADKRIIGYDAEETSNPGAAATVTSDFVHRYGWYPQRELYDTDPMTDHLVASQDVTTAGYISNVWFTSLDRAPLRWEYVHAALVTTANGENASRASAVNLTVEDTNAAYAVWRADVIRLGAPWRVYEDITDTSEFSGPYNLIIGTGSAHDSSDGASRPLPGSADLYHVELEGLAVPT